jgi:GNAT superfamily N-acetyltransferase
VPLCDPQPLAGAVSAIVALPAAAPADAEPLLRRLAAAAGCAHAALRPWKKGSALHRREEVAPGACAGGTARLGTRLVASVNIFSGDSLEGPALSGIGTNETHVVATLHGAFGPGAALPTADAARAALARALGAGASACTLLPHVLSVADLPVPPPPGWPADGPRLLLRRATGAGRGLLASRFTLIAAPPAAAAGAARRSRAHFESGGGGGAASAASAASSAAAAEEELCGEAVARALVAHAPGGPQLQLFEVVQRWRRLGLGSALLRALDAALCADAPGAAALRLSVSGVVQAHAFWRAAGFDVPPAGESGSKMLAPAAAPAAVTVEVPTPAAAAAADRRAALRAQWQARARALAAAE